MSDFLQDNYVDDPGDLVCSVDNPWLTPYVHRSFENIDWGWNSSVARTEQKHTFSHPVESVYNSLTNYDLVLERAGAFPSPDGTCGLVYPVMDSVPFSESGRGLPLPASHALIWRIGAALNVTESMTGYTRILETNAGTVNADN